MSTRRKVLRKLLLDAIDSNEAWLVLCDAIEEDDAHAWLESRVAMLVFREWQTQSWPAPLLQRQRTTSQIISDALRQAWANRVVAEPVRHPLFAMLKKGA